MPCVQYIYTRPIKVCARNLSGCVNQCDKKSPLTKCPWSFTLLLQNVAQNQSNKGNRWLFSVACLLQDVARRSVVKKVVDLQEEGGNTGETSKTRETSDLGGGARDGGDLGLLGGLGLLRGGGERDGGLGNTRNVGDGGVLVGRAVVADDSAGGDHGLGDGARAVGDGQSGGLGDRVGLGTLGDLGGLRAVGDVDVNDLGDDGAVVVSTSHGASGGGGDDSSDGVLHLVGVGRITRKLGISWFGWLFVLTKVLD